jgi:hypothetical protein
MYVIKNAMNISTQENGLILKHSNHVRTASGQGRIRQNTIE